MAPGNLERNVTHLTAAAGWLSIYKERCTLVRQNFTIAATVPADRGLKGLSGLSGKSPGVSKKPEDRMVIFAVITFRVKAW